MFLPWWTIKVTFETDVGFASQSESRNGWNYVLAGIAPALLLVAVFVAVVLPGLQARPTPTSLGSVPMLLAALVAAAAAALLVLLRFVIEEELKLVQGVSEADLNAAGATVSITRGIGLYGALLGSCAATIGSFMKHSGADGDTAPSGPATPF